MFGRTRRQPESLVVRIIELSSSAFRGQYCYKDGVPFSSPRGPQRIVCLTEEPTEILYALRQQALIVGISAYTVRPPEALEDKPVVSAFIGGSVSATTLCA